MIPRKLKVLYYLITRQYQAVLYTGLKLTKERLQHNLNYERIRRDFKKFVPISKWIRSPPKKVMITRETLANLPCLYAKTDAPVKSTILYLHGGGFILGLEHTDYEPVIGHLAKSCQAQVWAIDYRLAPEHKMPAALDDCYEAYLALLNQGIDPNTIFLVGESAGGTLTLALLIKLRDQKQPLPRAAVSISPAVGADTKSGSYLTQVNNERILTPAFIDYIVQAVFGLKDVNDYEDAPLKKDLKGLPPLFIMVGGHEILFDDSIQFAEKAKTAGVDVTLDVEPTMFHAYPIFVDIIPEANKAIKKIAAFIKSK